MIEFTSWIYPPGTDSLSFVVKKMGFNKYYISTLSAKYENSTLIYNNGEAVKIVNGTVTKITDPDKLEELALQCYLSIDHGYKYLGYDIKRIEDQKFTLFDCYGLMTSSPSGIRTLNYFDKNTGRLIMIIYASRNKSIFKSTHAKEGLTLPSHIIMMDAEKEELTESIVRRIEMNKDLDSAWFTIPDEGSYQTPESFRTGSFIYTDNNSGAVITRDKDKQVETHNGKSTEYRIEWLSANDYMLYRPKDASKPVTADNLVSIKVRITKWEGNKFYCHYMSSLGASGTCSFVRIK